MLVKCVDHTYEVHSIVLALLPTPYSLALALAKRPRYANGPRYANEPLYGKKARKEAPHPIDKCYKPYVHLNIIFYISRGIKLTIPRQLALKILCYG
ncbi:MAG: hypothetical protein F6K65_23165 [Moorea sp. SIO3C2]|nr:hypothetical protein [Moorena sp. SIO3C2]